MFLLQVPTASTTVEGNPALNRVRWAHSGKEIAVGDSDGQILVYDVGEVSGLRAFTVPIKCMAFFINSANKITFFRTLSFKDNL